MSKPEAEDMPLVFRIAKLLETGKLSDITFLVGPDSVPIKAHRLILSMSSSVIEDMLKDEQKTVTLPEVDPQSFKQLLQNIYTDKIEISSSWQEVCELYTIAKKFKFNSLTKKCLEFLGCCLKSHNAIVIYEFAKKHKEAALISSSMEFCCRSTRDVLNDDTFLKAKIDTITDLFRQQELAVDSEIDLVRAIRTVMVARKLNKDQIRKPIRNIRFLLLSHEQISSCKDVNAVLTQNDVLSLLLHLTTDKPSMALTEDLNKSKTPRN